MTRAPTSHEKLLDTDAGHLYVRALNDGTIAVSSWDLSLNGSPNHWVYHGSFDPTSLEIANSDHTFEECYRPPFVRAGFRLRYARKLAREQLKQFLASTDNQEWFKAESARAVDNHSRIRLAVFVEEVIATQPQELADGK